MNKSSLKIVGVFSVVLAAILAYQNTQKKPETTIKNNTQSESTPTEASRETRSKSKPQPVTVEMSGFTASFSDEIEQP